jgi:hypothetical protein
MRTLRIGIIMSLALGASACSRSLEIETTFQPTGIGLRYFASSLWKREETEVCARTITVYSMRGDRASIAWRIQKQGSGCQPVHLLTPGIAPQGFENISQLRDWTHGARYQLEVVPPTGLLATSKPFTLP